MEFIATSRIVDASCANSNRRIHDSIQGSPQEFLIDNGPLTPVDWYRNTDFREDQKEELGRLWQAYRLRTTEANGRFECESAAMAVHPFVWTVREEGDLPAVHAILDHSKFAHSTNPVIRNCPAFFKVRNKLTRVGNEYMLGPQQEGWVPAAAMWLNNREVVQEWLAQHCKSSRNSNYHW